MHKSLFKLFVFSPLTLCLLSCSDKDEPKEADYKFETLDKIIDGKIWQTTHRQFFTGDGTEISYDTSDRFPEGMPFDLYFTVNGDKLTDYYFIVFQHPWYKFTDNYSFDRNTGVITLENRHSVSGTPFAKILSVEDDKIILQACYGAVSTEDYEWDYDSYVLMEMQPVEDEELLAKFADAVER